MLEQLSDKQLFRLYRLRYYARRVAFDEYLYFKNLGHAYHEHSETWGARHTIIKKQTSRINAEIARRLQLIA